MSNTRRRVKLYVLNDERQWDDHGTGHVSSMYVDHEKMQGIVLLVRSEDDGSCLLESRIQTDTVYQKQEATLIVWSEGDNDLALSFQEKEGCDEIWEKICQVQGKDPSVDITQEVGEEDDEQFEEVQDFSTPIDLPPCELSKLEEIAELFASVLPSPLKRERLASAIEQEQYIKKLLNLFHICEDLETEEGLHHLHEIFKAIFILNKNSLFEIMFVDDNILDVLGVLEYDPNSKETIKHRQFVQEKARFKEVIPITSKDLLRKIHQTYKVQYIQDILVPVPTVFEDNMSTLSSFIFFSKIEIVNMIQEDERFLTELFARLKDDELSDDKRRELVLFLKELCHLSQTLQQHSRDSFLKALSAHGLLSTLATLLNIDDPVTKSAIVDILCIIVEYNPSMVREYLLKEANTTEEDQLLMNLLIDLMICGTDSSRSSLLLCLLRMLLDPENMSLGVNKMEKTEFLAFFYKHSMHVLTAPLFAATAIGDTLPKDDFKTAATLDHIIELLSFFVDHHTYHIKNYIINKDLLRRVLALMQSDHKFLALAALRFCRKIIGVKDEFYNRYIIKGKLLAPIVTAFEDNGNKYNMINSAIIELFEFIRIEDVKSLCTYVVEDYMSSFESVDYVQTFKGLKMRFEQEKDRLTRKNTDRNANHGIIHINSARYKRDARDLDEDEEIWFDREEDEDVSTVPVQTDENSKPTSTAQKYNDIDIIVNLKRTSNNSVVASNQSTATTTTTQEATIKNATDSPPKTIQLSSLTSAAPSVNSRKLPLGGLVDYPDDDEDDDDNGSGNSDEELMSPAKKQRLDATT
eukprot:gene3263-1591_t